MNMCSILVTKHVSKVPSFLGAYSSAPSLPDIDVSDSSLLGEAERQGINSIELRDPVENRHLANAFNIVVGESVDYSGTRVRTRNLTPIEVCNESSIQLDSAISGGFDESSEQTTRVPVGWQISAVFIGGIEIPVQDDMAAIEIVSSVTSRFISQFVPGEVPHSSKTRSVINCMRKHRGQIELNQLKKLEFCFGKLLLCIQDTVNNFAGLELCATHATGPQGHINPTGTNQTTTIICNGKGNNSVFRELISCFEILILYIECLLFPGLPSRMFIDETNEVLVGLLKLHCQTTLLSLPTPADPEAKCGLVALHESVTIQDASVFMCKLKEIFELLHISMSLLQFSESQTYQIISSCLEALKLREPEHDLWTAVTDLLVLIFRGFHGYEGTILTGLVAHVKHLECNGRKVKRFRVLNADGSELHYFTVILLRIFQSICVPKGNDEKGASVNIKRICSRSSALQTCCFRVADQLVYSCIQQEFKDSRAICKLLLDDFCKASRSPLWPAAPILVTSIVTLFSSAVLGEFKASCRRKLDSSTKEFCMLMLGEIGSFLFLDESKAQKTFMQIPPLPCSVKDYRNLIMKGENCICGRPVENQFTQCVACGLRLHSHCIPTDDEKATTKADSGWQCFSCHFEAVGFDLFREKKSRQWDNASKAEFLSWKAFVVFGDIILSYLRSFKSRVAPVFVTDIEDYSQRMKGPNSHMSHVNVSVFHEGLCIVADHPAFASCTLLCRLVTSCFNSNNSGSPSGSLVAEELLSLLNANDSVSPIVTEQLALRLWRLLVCNDLTRSRLLITRCVGVVLTSNLGNSLRRAGVVALSEMLYANSSMVKSGAVVNFIKDALMDKAPKVRERALAMLERLLGKLEPSRTFVHHRNHMYRRPACVATQQLDAGSAEHLHAHSGSDNTFLVIAAQFAEMFAKMTADVSPLVRAQAVKILRQICVDQPEADFTRIASVKLLERLISPKETSNVRLLVLDTFSKMWFSSIEKPSKKVAHCMVETIGTASKLLDEDEPLLDLVISHIKNQKHASDKDINVMFEVWLNVLLELFLDQSSQESDGVLETLHAIRLLGAVKPESLVRYLKYFKPYLKESLSQERSRSICYEICELLSLALPFAGTSPSTVKMIESVQYDLKSLIGQKTQIMRSAIGCLCVCVKHITFQYRKCIEPLLVNSLKQLLSITNIRGNHAGILPNGVAVEVQKVCFQLACLCEKLDLPSCIVIDVGDNFTDDEVFSTEGRSSSMRQQTPLGKAHCNASHARSCELMAISSIAASIPVLKEDMTRLIHVTQLIFDLFCSVFELFPSEKLRAFLLLALAIFLVNNRYFVRSRRLRDIFSVSLSSTQPAMRRNACHGLYRLLTAFKADALQKANKRNHDKDQTIYPHQDNVCCEDKEVSSKVAQDYELDSDASAMECVQPLAFHLDSLLRILLEDKLPNASNSTDCSTHYYALRVVGQLYRQGLINPSDIVAPMFCLSFSCEGSLRFRAYALLSSIAAGDMRYLVNNLVSCFQQSFGFLVRRYPESLCLFGDFASDLVEPFMKLYAERCRAKKSVREKVIRTLCKQIECAGESVEFSNSFQAIERAEAPSLPSVINNGTPLHESLINNKSSFPLKYERKRDEASLADLGHLTFLEYFPLLYLQFISMVLCNLPYTYDSEVLFLIYELNKYVSMHALMMSPLSQDHNTSPISSQAVPYPSLASCCSCFTAVLVKKYLQKRYKITDESCQLYDPLNASSKNEKARFLLSVDEDGKTSATFPLDIFTSRILTLLVRRKDDQELFTYGSSILGDESAIDINVGSLDNNRDRVQRRSNKRPRQASRYCGTTKKKTRAKSSSDDSLTTDETDST